jgi:hypothetical protein
MWNLDRIHKIAELIGSVAVIISLLFVGMEVRQNNQIQRQLATRTLVRDWSDAYAAYTNPEIACLFLRLGTERASLTAQEATQVESVLVRIYKVLEELHYQHEQGMVDDSVWSGFKQLIVIEAGFEGYRVWWLGYQKTFSPRFREFMGEILSSVPVNPEPYYSNLKCDTPVGNDYWQEY